MNAEKIINKFSASLLLLLAGWAVFMVGVQTATVPTVDGAIRADEARTIIRTGKWFPIVSMDTEQTDHPPLYIWMSAVSMKIFGVSDFAANFPQRLFAVLLILVTGLLAGELGLGVRGVLLSGIVLCLTRDHVLSSVRGYIEPILDFFAYFAFYASVRALKRGEKVFAALAGVSLWFALFAKGPPAFWPILFVAGVYFLPKIWGTSWKESLKLFSWLCVGALLCVAIFISWNEQFQYWPYWAAYWKGQVLASALEGRAGAQGLEPFYFLNILWSYYWPWLIFLVASFVLFFRKGSLIVRDGVDYLKAHHALVLIYGLGFVGGFSLVKWKFWYYIDPAYPAFAIAIAAYLSGLSYKILTEDFLKKFIFFGSFLWMILIASFPIPLYLERAPEVMAFKETIRNSNIEGPVWFIHSLRDHNIVGTSGNWYFDRQVLKVTDDQEKEWFEKKLKSKSWIITAKAHYAYCMSAADLPRHMKVWCEKSTLIQTSDDTVLLLYSSL